MANIAVHWFRKGLRLHDNPALLSSLESGPSHLFPTFCLDPWFANPEKVGVVRYRFLLQSLVDLDTSLQKMGSRLYVLMGKPEEEMVKLWKGVGASSISWEFDSEPYAKERDEKMEALANAHGIHVSIRHGHTMFPLTSYASSCGGDVSKLPKTYKSFIKMWEGLGSVPKPLDAPSSIPFDESIDALGNGIVYASSKGLHVPSLEEMGYPCSEPSFTIAPGGEQAGLTRLMENMERKAWVKSFSKPSTSPASLEPDTTVLSPYLKFGCVSVRKMFHDISEVYSTGGAHTKPPTSLIGQLLFREYFYLCAHTYENYDRMEGNAFVRQIPWDSDAEMVDRWEHGRTGYPWIDALMNQLRQEGWMHHLGRHCVACFLTRGDLWQSWEEGVRVFSKYLVDEDWSLNNSNWMWLSCSAFFHQYHRVYSPVSFPKKYSSTAPKFIKKYVPQLASFPDKYIYEPWKAPMLVQQAAGCTIGVDYPKPMVDHASASKRNKDRMAAAFAQAKRKKAEQTQAGGKKKRAKRSTVDRK